MVFKKSECTLTQSDINWYEAVNKGFRCTGEVITESTYEPLIKDCLTISRVVMTGPYTPFGMMRDCGDHYIIARYSQYDRLEKDLKTLTPDVEDR